ncbi:hypothetical protein H2248_008334 [Termitomyces sp. 'cryptogamus']|nr:hypothetical protein H2248_008334 [Termitomyces sp. 'cryptogamus']
MRVSVFLATVGAFVLSVSTVAAEDAAEPAVVASAVFPEANPFGHVVNGEKNSLLLNIENKSGRNVTLINISGSVSHPETHRLVKNLTTTKFGVTLPEDVKLELPYAFYSEFKPGDLRLSVWLEHSTDGETYRVSVYDSVVTIVEPEISILDFKLIATYLMVATILGGLAYLAYLNFVPQTRSRSKKSFTSSQPSATTTATTTGAGSYQEEWIPEHHLKKFKKSSGAATSGDEISGSELSSTEGRKRKGKK